MRKILSVVFLVLALPVAAQDHRAGIFDYYVLALSWSPNWCVIEGDGRGSPQCDAGTGFGWVLHGLWPQYDRGWPQDCRTPYPPPSRALTESMTGIMGTSGLAWHQWRKHGSCSGLSPADYFALSRLAVDRVVVPAVFGQLPRAVALPADLVEEAFVRDNPGLAPGGITITCRAGRIQEARLCLTRDLEFRLCGADVARDCALDDALMDPVR